jgi:LacI family transcriptional regulator
LPIVVIDPMNMPRADDQRRFTNFTGGLTATQHLLDLGHRRIAYIGGPATAERNQARMHGYRSAMLCGVACFMTESPGKAGCRASGSCL